MVRDMLSATAKLSSTMRIFLAFKVAPGHRKQTVRSHLRDGNWERSSGARPDTCNRPTVHPGRTGMRRETDRLDPPGMSRSHRRLRRSSPAANYAVCYNDLRTHLTLASSLLSQSSAGDTINAVGVVW